MTYAFLAAGLEEVEALTVIDVLRRAGEPVTTVSITDNPVVMGAHNVPLIADAVFSAVDFSDADALFLPGGMPGATNLDAHEGLRQLILKCAEAGKVLAAICAAPLVYGHLGLTQGKRCTCYPGFETELAGADYTAGLVEVDGNLFTGCGPAAGLELGYLLAERLVSKQVADQLREGMQYNKLMNA